MDLLKRLFGRTNFRGHEFSDHVLQQPVERPHRRHIASLRRIQERPVVGRDGAREERQRQHGEDQTRPPSRRRHAPASEVAVPTTTATRRCPHSTSGRPKTSAWSSVSPPWVKV